MLMVLTCDELNIDYNVIIYYVNFKFIGDIMYTLWFKPALCLGILVLREFTSTLMNSTQYLWS